ncbi:MAG: hypothetical protein M1812_005016 [Candelaria pacifica]|nr:MAG: hypothetical protein M1812_005016 [Candelaria pacifica]
MPPSKLPLTHFLCLPLVTETSKPQLQASLRDFTSELLGAVNDDTAAVIPEKAIRPVGTLHLTLGVMSLTSPERVDGAMGLLEQIDLQHMLREAGTETSQPAPTPLDVSQIEAKGTDLISPLMVTLSSLASMHTPRSTSLLYAIPMDTSHRVLPFCLSLRDTFLEAGFLLPDERPLLLHATILNTIYATDRRSRGTANRRGQGLGEGDPSQNASGSRGHGRKRGKLNMDATNIIQRYDGYEWAKDFRIEKVAICKMGAKKSIGQDGIPVEEYEQVASRPLP